MIKVTINEKGGGERVLSFEKDGLTLGRSQRNDVILPRSNVSKKHAVITAQGSTLIITDQNSTNGTFVNGRRITKPAAVTPQDKVFISDFVMIFEHAPGSGLDLEATFPPPLPSPSDDEVEELDDDLIEPVTVPPRRTALDEVEAIEEIEPEEEEEPVPLEREEPPVPQEAAPASGEAVEVGKRVFDQVDSVLHLERIEAQVFRDEDFRKRTSLAIAETLDAMVDAGQIPPELEPSQVATRVTAEILGLGPLDGLLEDPSVHEVIVPARGRVCVHAREGVRQLDDPFISDRSRQLILRKLGAMVRGQQTEGAAALSGHLDGGEEVFMLMPPVVMEGVAAVIRKPPASSEGGMDALVARGILSQEMARFLGFCIEARKGVLVCDPGLGSHRTLIPALVSMLEPWERLVALQCGRELIDAVDPQIYAVLPGSGEDSLGFDSSSGDLIGVLGAFRPTALVAGDIQSIDHFRLIRKASSSRSFTCATIDAESEVDGLARLGGWLAREHSIIPRAVATGIMLDAVHIVVFHSRMMDGTEKVTRISELLPGKEGLPTLKPIFHYQVRAVTDDGRLDGTFRSTRHVPSFLDTRKGRGKGKFDTSIFQ